MMAAAISAGPRAIRAETRASCSPLTPDPGLREFDVTRYGQRFLLILNSRTGGYTRLTAASNSRAALRK